MATMSTPTDVETAPLFACTPPAPSTPAISAATLRRPVSGMTTVGCDPATGCC